MTGPTGEAGCVAELLQQLTAEERAVELFAYRHQVCLLVMATGELAHLAMAVDDLEEAEQQLALIGVRRSIAAAEAGARWGVAPDATLAELADAAPGDEVAGLLRAARGRLVAAMAEVVELRKSARTLARGLHPVLGERRDRLAATFDAATYGPG